MRVWYGEKNLFSLRIMKKSVTKIFGIFLYSFLIERKQIVSLLKILTICNFDLSRSPVYLYDRNEAATAERKLNKAKDSKYTN